MEGLQNLEGSEDFVPESNNLDRSYIRKQELFNTLSSVRCKLPSDIEIADDKTFKSL